VLIHGSSQNFAGGFNAGIASTAGIDRAPLPFGSGGGITFGCIVDDGPICDGAIDGGGGNDGDGGGTTSCAVASLFAASLRAATSRFAGVLASCPMIINQLVKAPL
jgi:hypothetical protein